MPESIAAGLLEAARAIRVDQDVDTVLDDLVHAAIKYLPGVTHAGVTIAWGTGQYETRASSDPLVDTLDNLQYKLGEGPCLQALESSQLVLVNSLRQTHRWQKFVPHAAALGLRAQLGIGLRFEERTVGSLNLYSTDTDELTADVVRLGELFALPASLAIGFVQQREQLGAALSSRATIGQAVGLVMHEFTMDSDTALAYLRRLSSHSNTKLRDVAAALVEQANEKARAEKTSR